MWPSCEQKPDSRPLHLHVAPGQGQCWKESRSTWWGSLPPQPVRSVPGWARSGLINSLNLSFQGERKRFQLYAILQKAKNSGDSKKMSGRQEFAERNVQSTDVFMSSESTLSHITMIDICGHTFVQTHRICNTALLVKVNPKVNWGCFDYVSMQASLV